MKTATVAERRPAVASRAHPFAAAVRPIPIARTVQQRLGNRGTQAFAAQVVARLGAPAATSTTGTAAGQLSISQPGDAHEREADRMADVVMRMPDSDVQSPMSAAKSTPSVQRLCADCDEGLSRRAHVEKPKITTGVGQLQRMESSAEATQVSPAVAASIHAMQGGGRP